jgi:hypothetical protein
MEMKVVRWTLWQRPVPFKLDKNALSLIEVARHTIQSKRRPLDCNKRGRLVVKKKEIWVSRMILRAISFG